MRPQSCFVRVLLLLAFALGGCSTLRPSAGPSSTSSPSVLPSAQELLQTIETRRQALTSLRGLARIVYKDSQEKGTAKQAIAVAAPDHFRWELFSPIGVAALVASNGKTLSTYFPSEKVLYRGEANAENVARFTRVFLSPREIVGLLLGTPVLPTNREACTIRFVSDLDWYQVHCPGANGESWDLWFERNTRQLRRAEKRTAEGATTQRMELADYRAVGDLMFPFEIVLSDLRNQQQASVLYERVELNPHPAESIFTLASINGVREINADAFTSSP